MWMAEFVLSFSISGTEEFYGVMIDELINKTTTVIYTASLVQFQISALTKLVAVAESIDKASCLVVWINEVWLNF